MTQRRVSILGSTGSIGCSTLDVISHSDPGAFDVVALTAHKNAEKLARQALEFNAEYAALADPSEAETLRSLLAGSSVEIGIGPEAVEAAGSCPADFVMAAITGAAGLKPALAAISQGAVIGLANKECLVCAGDMFMAQVKAGGATLLPVDSEHNAIFQVLSQDQPEQVRRLILTASGGPFRQTPKDQFNQIQVQDALNHPVWSMGDKITIDSATLMNKGLELIEASFLFDRPSSDIDIVVHPQSVVHSMVEYVDGSVLCQMGTPDMRIPIAYALGWPGRLETRAERLDFKALSDLSFEEPDCDKFRCLSLARQALEAGGHAPNILNAANEIAVAAFLQEALAFVDIPAVVARAVEEVESPQVRDRDPGALDDILFVDGLARATARTAIKALL